MCIRNKDRIARQIKTGYKVCIRDIYTGNLFPLYSPLKQPFFIGKVIKSENDYGYHYFEKFKAAEKLLMRSNRLRTKEQQEELVIVRVRSRKIISTGFGGTASFIKIADGRIIESRDLYIHSFIYASNRGVIYGQ